VNTEEDFFWLTNFLETLISNMLWMPMTAATTAHHYKEILSEACLKTNKEAIDFVDFQGHNFGMRGMAGIDATIYSGLGHATSFKGDDSLPTIAAARKHYGETGFVVGSVNATEHSVMCAGGDKDELDTFRYLMKQFPTGILSIVSDTWDLWKVCTNFLPQLKEEILARDGKIVIRPDSGDPVDIICGERDTVSLNASKGVIELLWDIFGGHENEQGYKILDPHIGAIYGDSITPQRAKDICARLEAKGFASTNIVLGIGSYTYQYVTRDTHGFAMKATYCEVNGEGREIFKDPITDDGGKKSAKGLLQVLDNADGEYFLVDQVSWGHEEANCLQTIFEDGEFENQVTLTEIRERISKL
jgi:nicotinamide phosphoribosyltransferase